METNNTQSKKKLITVSKANIFYIFSFSTKHKNALASFCQNRAALKPPFMKFKIPLEPSIKIKRKYLPYLSS